MNDPECVTCKVKIAPHDYSKENLLATLTPQKQLTPEQIFWSKDLMKIKSEALKERTKGIQNALTKEVKEMKYVFEELETEVAQHAVVKKHDAIELKNLLISNDNLITECLSQEVFCVATNSELNIARFTDMHVANTTAETRYLALEAELANLHQIGNSPPTPDKDTLDFDSVFVIGKMQASLQGKDNVICQLKKELSQLQVTRRDTDRARRVQTTESQITKLTDQVTHLQAQNDLFRDENDKVKQRYKQLYDSIKITRAKHIKQVTKLTAKNVKLRTSVSKAKVQPSGLTRTKHAVDVELIVPCLRNNRDAHLDYLRHLNESMKTIRDIVKEAKVVKPLDRSIVSACRYTKHSQELLEYAIGTCPHGSQPRAKQHIPLIKKKQVIVAQPSNTLDSTTHPHVVTVTSQKTDVPVPPSSGVDSCPIAGGSKPMSHVAEEDADFQKAVEESMKDAYSLPKGPLPPVVIREFDEEESKKVMLGDEKGSQDEGQARSNPNETSEGQAGSNPDETSKGQARLDPGNAEARVQSTSSLVVHAGSDREHMDIDVANVSLQPSTEQLYEGEPASSSGTISSLQHLSRDFTFGDQFFSDKPSDADKSAETEVESMVNVPIQQAMSSISLMTSPIIDLTSRPESPKEHPQLKATTTDTTTTTTTMLPPLQAPQQSMTEAMMVKRIGELEHTQADLIQVNKTMEESLDKHRARLYTLEQLDIPQQVSIAVSEVVTDAVDWAMQAPLRNRFRDLPEADMKEILHQRMWETDSYKSHEVRMKLFEALEKSNNRDQSEELVHDLAEAQKKRKKGHESPKMPPGSPSHQPPPPPPPAGPSGTSRAPRASESQVTPPPPPPTSTNQDSPFTGSAAPSPTKTATTTKHQAWSTPDVMLKPLVSLTPEDLDMDEAMDLEYLRYGSKGRRPTLSISKMKAAYYPDAGLEQMVPYQFWIEEECKYDIAVITVRTHMRILSVVRIEVFSMYGYDYMKKIVLRRADLNEHVIAERDFKYMYPSDFEDLNLLNL
nr:hypothetical protein [Tanacetum cinerariifolium]